MANSIKTKGARIVAAAAFVVATAGTTGVFSQQSTAADEPIEGEPVESEPVESEPVKSETSALKKRLVFLLSTYHTAPTPQQLADVGSATDSAALLREIAADNSARPSMRLRAVDSLGHYSDPESLDFLERTIETPSSLDVRRAEHAQLLRQHAMLSYARVRGEAAVARLARFLTVDSANGETDLQLRLTAISALGRFGGQAGRIELDKLSGRLEHPALKRSLNKFIAPSSQ
jgi:hypothetical protein